MYHNSAKIIILCMLCILQLQPYLLTMASKSPTGIIIISTIKSSMPSAQSTAPGKREPDIPLTSSTPNPTPTSVVQHYVTDAA